MTGIKCKYHPQVPARRCCSACNINVCSQCAKATGVGERRKYLCPVCEEELDSLGIGGTIQPFWERIPKFFAYPATLDGLIYLGVLSLSSFIVLFIGTIGLLLFLAIYFAILKYAYKILDHTARGNLSPPQVLADSSGKESNLPLKQLGVFVLMSIPVALLFNVGAVAGMVALAFMLLSLPASVMVMAIDQSFFQALNPVKVTRVMTQIGKPYLILWIFLLLLSAGSNIAQQLLLEYVPILLLIIIATFVWGYFTLIMFHMMGYIIYQYHEELGFEGVKEFEEEAESPSGSKASVKTEDPLLNEINILISEGKTEDAKTRMKKILADSNQPEHHQRYHKLLVLSGDKQELVRHGKEYISLLTGIDESRPTLLKSLDIYLACLNADKTFQISDAYITCELADIAQSMGKADPALRMLNKFAQRYSNSRSVPRAYFLAAKIMSERKHQDAQAKKILESLLRKYPDHELVPEIEQFLGVIKRLQNN